MGRDVNHVEAQELLGVHALDALDADERDAVERHVRDCRACQGELAEHREVAAFLTPGGAPPPEGAWARIAGSLEERPPPLDLAPVVPLRPRRGAGMRAAALVAGVAVAVIGVMAVKIVDDRRRIDRLAAGIHSQELERAANAAAAEPGADRVALRSGDGALFAEAVMLDDGTGYLVRHNLPPLPPDRTYQLWAVSGSSTISVGVLGRSPDVAAFQATGPVSALAVTEEPSGGVVATGQPPVVVGRTNV